MPWLSVSSEYFENIFKTNNESKLLICLTSICSQDLKNCLDYMYNGEVQIYQEELDNFLSVAQTLKVKGLINNISNKDEQKVPKDIKENYIGPVDDGQDPIQ